MSLRDGIHRRALLTARFGVARFGASRFGWTPGQEDLEGLTREIKASDLTGTGAFYVWRERYANASPFSGLVSYSSTGVVRMELETTCTFKTVFTVMIQVATESDSEYRPVLLANLELSTDCDVSYVGGSPSSMSQRRFGPNPFAGPARGVR